MVKNPRSGKKVEASGIGEKPLLVLVWLNTRSHAPIASPFIIPKETSIFPALARMIPSMIDARLAVPEAVRLPLVPRA